MIGEHEKDANTGEPHIERISGRWPWALLILGVLIALAWSLSSDWPRPVTALDINQHRLNSAVLAPTDTDRIEQTFIPQHDGLSELELLLVKYDVEQEPGTDGSAVTFSLYNQNDELITSETRSSGDITHNQFFSLRFPDQAGSLGQPYTLVLEGNGQNLVSAWGYDLDVYDDGFLTINGQPAATADLRFITRYKLTTVEGLTLAVKMLASNLTILLLAFLFLLLPGAILLIIGRHWFYNWHLGVLLGTALALGAAAWSIIWLWTSLIGIRWRPWSLWLVFVAGWLIVIVWLARRAVLNKRLKNVESGNSSQNQDPAGIGERALRTIKRAWPLIVLLLIVLLGLAVRLLAVRDLAFPPWVDSSRHGLITNLMAETGQFPQDYEPFLPVDRTLYHYGFHTISASLSMMSGQATPQLLLILGQLLNALIPLTVFSGAYIFTRKNNISLIAALLVALPLFFPAYYATWGRMTQITAVMVLPVAIAAVWSVIRGNRQATRQWPYASILAAGLFLIHFRVFLLFIPFVILVLVVSFGRHWRWIAAAGVVGLALVLPRIVQLYSDLSDTSIFSSPESYNVFPEGYLEVGWETALLWIALGALIIAIYAAIRKQRWALLPIVLALWVGLVAFLLSGQRLGLPESWVLNVNSAYIVLFLPMALILSIVFVRSWEWLVHRQLFIGFALWILAGVALTFTLIFGIHQQVSILNPETILAHEADIDGLNWLKEQGRHEDLVAVSSWKWLGNAWAGSDGGAWILPLTGSGSTTPPVDYAYSAELSMEIAAFNEAASQIDDWSDPNSLELLKERGVEHIYVGSRGGFFDPADLSNNDELKLIYRRDGVFIFSLK